MSSIPQATAQPPQAPSSPPPLAPARRPEGTVSPSVAKAMDLFSTESRPVAIRVGKSGAAGLAVGASICTAKAVLIPSAAIKAAVGSKAVAVAAASIIGKSAFWGGALGVVVGVGISSIMISQQVQRIKLEQRIVEKLQDLTALVEASQTQENYAKGIEDTAQLRNACIELGAERLLELNCLCCNLLIAWLNDEVDRRRAPPERRELPPPPRFMALFALVTQDRANPGDNNQAWNDEVKKAMDERLDELPSLALDSATKTTLQYSELKDHFKDRGREVDWIAHYRLVLYRQRKYLLGLPIVGKDLRNSTTSHSG